MSFIQPLLSTRAPATVLVRAMVGLVFLTEGVLKFTLAEERGAGRFARIGIPAPGAMGSFVGVLEIACGTLLLFGLLSRAIVYFSGHPT